MFWKKKEPSLLDEAITQALAELNVRPIASQEYMKTLNIVSQLKNLKADEKPSRPSPDTMAIIGANLLGIVLIIKHEHLNVITSRAMNMVLPTRTKV